MKPKCLRNVIMDWNPQLNISSSFCLSVKRVLFILMRMCFAYMFIFVLIKINVHKKFLEEDSLKTEAEVFLIEK